MKLKEKLRLRRKLAFIARVCTLLTITYLMMIFIKSVYLITKGSEFHPIAVANDFLKRIIEFTFVFPVDWLWSNISYFSLTSTPLAILDLYALIAIPMIIMMICAFFISDYRKIKLKYLELKEQIEKEIALREMRKEAGIESIPENASIDIIIDNANNDDPAWHSTVWGQIFIGVAVAAIGAAIGIN